MERAATEEARLADRWMDSHGDDLFSEAAHGGPGASPGSSSAEVRVTTASIRLHVESTEARDGRAGKSTALPADLKSRLSRRYL
jgi:hypothetical protein